MKKYLILFLTLGLLATTSCSDDDEDVAERTIVGTWVLVNVTPDVLDPSACESESMITFEEDNTAEGSFYFPINECTELSSSGSWSKGSGNSYTIEVPQFGELEGDITFLSDNKFSFATTIVIDGFGSVPAVFTFERA